MTQGKKGREMINNNTDRYCRRNINEEKNQIPINGQNGLAFYTRITCIMHKEDIFSIIYLCITKLNVLLVFPLLLQKIKLSIVDDTVAELRQQRPLQLKEQLEIAHVCTITKFFSINHKYKNAFYWQF